MLAIDQVGNKLLEFIDISEERASLQNRDEERNSCRRCEEPGMERGRERPGTRMRQFLRLLCHGCSTRR